MIDIKYWVSLSLYANGHASAGECKYGLAYIMSKRPLKQNRCLQDQILFVYSKYVFKMHSLKMHISDYTHQITSKSLRQSNSIFRYQSQLRDTQINVKNNMCYSGWVLSSCLQIMGDLECMKPSVWWIFFLYFFLFMLS